MTPAAFYESLFADAARAGVYHLPHAGVGDLLKGAGAAGCCAFRVDLSQMRDKDGMLHAVAKALAFPEWFGANWDALTECLLDMGWRPATGYVVVLDHADRAHGLAEADFVTLLQVFQDVADQWREDGVPFWCLVDMVSDGIAFLPTMPQPAAPAA